MPQLIFPVSSVRMKLNVEAISPLAPSEKRKRKRFKIYKTQWRLFMQAARERRAVLQGICSSPALACMLCGLSSVILVLWKLKFNVHEELPVE